MKLYFTVIGKIWPDLLFKIAGTLFPFYLGAFILYFINNGQISKVLDSQSFILYSSSFLFSTLYLWYKTLNNKKNELLSFLCFIIMTILIALLYSFSLIENKDTSASESNTIDTSMCAYILFFLTLFIYIFYECKDWIKKENTKPYEESAIQFDSLKESFKNLN